MIATIYTEPTVEPLSVDDAKTHLRITSNDDDIYISSLINAARKYIESYTGRVLITQTWDMYINAFPIDDTPIEIPKSPLSSVTSITYVDNAGASQTLSSSVYTVDTDSTPGRVYLAYSQAWPATRDQRKAVKVRFVAGYGSSGDSVPEAINHALMLIVQSMKEQPTDKVKEYIDEAVASLLVPYRLNYL